MPSSLAKTHTNYSPMWGTAPDWLEWVTATLGGPWWDPCPADWQPGDEDGLLMPWTFPSYCNHPGAKGSTKKWWTHAVSEMVRDTHAKGRKSPFIWCGFNIEQVRHMGFQLLYLDGYLVLPNKRIPYVWLGKDLYSEKTGKLLRKHGQLCKSVGNWSFFFSTVEPAPLPKGYEQSVILRTGYRHMGFVEPTDK